MKVIILAGGGGTRLFPLSRSCYPKQFLEIAGQPSLLAQTISRYRHAASDSDIIIITNDKYIFHVKDELRRLGAADVHILTEPVGRNTAPAIALAMSYAMHELGARPEETVVVTPSDHRIEPEDAYIARIRDAAEIAAGGSIVTLGVVPERAETVYGYIEAAEERIGRGYHVHAFTEKPDEETAERYVAAGNYYWNSGVFIFEIRTMIQEMKQLAPAIAALASGGYEETLAHFREMPDISIDYAIAEKSYHIAVVPMNGIRWSDIGSFDAIFDLLHDDDGNAIYGDVKSKECRNTMLLGGKRLIVGLGLEDIMVVDTPDALLVTRRGESQKVKDIVSELKTEHRREAEENLTMYRPWGSYTILTEGNGYKVKKLVVNPGARLSLQMHYHRSEHWTVISGTGEVTIDDKKIMLHENESTFIPVGAKHQLQNLERFPLVVIEVQCGKHLSEDDIVGFNDDDRRNAV